MDEGKFAADFISSNLEKVWELAKRSYGSIDENLRIKLKKAYEDYLTNTRGRYSKSKSFFIRSQAVDLYSYYVPTGIACGSKLIQIPKFSSCINFSERIVITGTGGSGKSVLMRHLFLDCISNKDYVPILIELRDLNTANQSLDDYIENTLDQYGFDISGKYVFKAKQAGHFCFFLDGYDEVNHSLRQKLIKQINNLSTKYKKCPIFISSRPDEVFNGIEEFAIFRILPLNLDSATSLISKLPFDRDIKRKFVEDLKDGLFEKHQSFLSNPLLLSIMLLTYGENAEIPSKLSIFYNQAYEALFQRHDANKAGYRRERRTSLDIQDFARVFSLFALQTYEKRLFTLSRVDCLRFIEKSRDNLKKEFNPEDYLFDLLTAACLMVEDGLDISYSHRSFQEYFVALYISNAAPEIQKKLLDRYWKNMTSDNVIELLVEINPELIERELIIPKLEQLFLEIGVKKQVGITHAAKYLRKVYSSINVECDRMSASHEGHEANITAIIRLAIGLCKNFSFPNEEYFMRHQTEMYEKYGNGKERESYKTKDLTYKSPIMVDTLNSNGAFSKKYLQAAYETYKKLKSKHENRAENLEELLAI